VVAVTCLRDIHALIAQPEMPHGHRAVEIWALALGVSTAPYTDLRPSDPVPESVPDPASSANPGRRPTLVVDTGPVRGADATTWEAIWASVVPGTRITVKSGTCREAPVVERLVEVINEADRICIVVQAIDTGSNKLRRAEMWSGN